MLEVCHNVAIDIIGEILSGAFANTQDGARLDVAAEMVSDGEADL